MPMPKVEPCSTLSSAELVTDILQNFEEMTMNARQVQQDVLQAILEKNAGTEYLRQFGVEEDTDEEAFKCLVPLVTHADIKGYIQRIVEGDRSPILTSDPVDKIFLSSGTTNGEQKYIPLYKKILENSLYLGKLGAAFRSMAFPLSPGGRSLELCFCGRMLTTVGGLEAGTATTHLFRSDEFKESRKAISVNPCTPEAVMFGASQYEQAMYCYLLCAFLYRMDVQYISATFAYTLVEAFNMLEREWKTLCNDIRQGYLSHKIDDPALRLAIAPLLQQHNHRHTPETTAAEIASICQEHPGAVGLIPDLWPNCKYLYSIMTGSMAPYLEKLTQYAGGLPLVSADYGATENWIAVNTNPKAAPCDATFTVVPSFGYFEFIPLIRCDSQLTMNEISLAATAFLESDAVGLTQVIVGHEYEVVLTTFGGLYRYRLGDIVRVTGFYNSSPQLSYVCRKNVLLSIHIDKNTEKDILMVVSKAAAELRQANSKLELVDFTSYADLSSTPGHYVFFWEVQGYVAAHSHEDPVKKTSRVNDDDLFRHLASLMDASFVDPGYVGCRKVKTIGPLELRLVKPGSFRFLLQQYLARGASAISQYKTPRCINSNESLKILNAATLTSFHSTLY